jgi:hypothetical protein
MIRRESSLMQCSNTGVECSHRIIYSPRPARCNDVIVIGPIGVGDCSAHVTPFWPFHGSWSRPPSKPLRLFQNLSSFSQTVCLKKSCSRYLLRSQWVKYGLLGLFVRTPCHVLLKEHFHDSSLIWIGLMIARSPVKNAVDLSFHLVRGLHSMYCRRLDLECWCIYP